MSIPARTEEVVTSRQVDAPAHKDLGVPTSRDDDPAQRATTAQIEEGQEATLEIEEGDEITQDTGLPSRSVLTPEVRRRRVYKSSSNKA